MTKIGIGIATGLALMGATIVVVPTTIAATEKKNIITNDISIEKTQVVANKFNGIGDYYVNLGQQPKNDLLNAKLINDPNNTINAKLVGEDGLQTDIVVNKQTAVIHVELRSRPSTITSWFDLELSYLDKDGTKHVTKFEHCQIVVPYLPIDEGNLLKVCALENSSVKLISCHKEGFLPDCSYSFDGTTWSTLGDKTVVIAKDQFVYLKGNNPTGWYIERENGATINFSGKVHLDGSVMGLIDNGTGSKIIPYGSSFEHLFDGQNSIVTTGKDLLPATTLTVNAYRAMFSECLYMQTAPNLRCTILPQNCYDNMFYKCYSLEETPFANFEDVDKSACGSMFALCGHLTRTNIHILRGCSFSEYCFTCMYMDCVHLTNGMWNESESSAPFCFMRTYERCSSLTDPGELPAKILATNCYTQMFVDCEELEYPPELPATELADSCYFYMFSNCKKMKVAPELPATELPERCYSFMFSGCESLAAIKVYFTQWPNDALQSTYSWVYGVGGLDGESGGTFICPHELTVKYGNDYIPSKNDYKWAVEQF